jgi:RecB family exonuclease
VPEAKQYLVLSNSKVKTWNRCESSSSSSTSTGLRPKKRTIQLERGSWVHELLMVHYDGHDWRERHAELSAEFYELFEEEREELGDLPNECGRLVRNYLHHWRHEDKLYKTIDTELDEVLELPNGLKIRIIIDKIVEDRSGGIWVVDYKTGKNFLDPDWLILDPQLARYHWSADKLGYTPLRGVIYDEIRTKPPTMPKASR